MTAGQVEGEFSLRFAFPMNLSPIHSSVESGQMPVQAVISGLPGNLVLMKTGNQTVVVPAEAAVLAAEIAVVFAGDLADYKHQGMIAVKHAGKQG